MDNFIEVYKNVFDDDFCNTVIKHFNDAEDLNIVFDRQSLDQAPKLHKQDKSLYIPYYPLHHEQKEIYSTFLTGFWGKCYKEYSDKYSILSTCAPHNSYTMKIQKTRPGEGYHTWHCETSSKESSARILAWTAYLNDDFEAGETEFIYQQYRYKPSKGDVVIFPAAFTHTHRGNPPIGGDKYIITGWIEY